MKTITINNPISVSMNPYKSQIINRDLRLFGELKNQLFDINLYGVNICMWFQHGGSTTGFNQVAGISISQNPPYTLAGFGLEVPLEAGVDCFFMPQNANLYNTDIIIGDYTNSKGTFTADEQTFYTIKQMDFNNPMYIISKNKPLTLALSASNYTAGSVSFLVKIVTTLYYKEIN